MTSLSNTPFYILQGYNRDISMPIVCGREPAKAHASHGFPNMEASKFSSVTGSVKPLKTDAVRVGIEKFTGLQNIPTTIGQKVPSDSLKIFGQPVKPEDEPSEQPTSLKDAIIGAMGRNDGIKDTSASFLVSPENTLVPHASLKSLYDAASSSKPGNSEIFKKTFSQKAVISEEFQGKIYDIAVTVVKHDDKIGVGVSDAVQVPHLWIRAFHEKGGVASDSTMAKEAKKTYKEIENDADWHGLIDKGFNGEKINPQPRQYYLEQSVVRALEALSLNQTSPSL